MRIRLPRNASTFDLKPFDFDRPKKEDRGLISFSSRLWNYEVYYMLIEAPFLPALGNLVMLRGMIDKTDVHPKESIIFSCANLIFYEGAELPNPHSSKEGKKEESSHPF